MWISNVMINNNNSNRHSSVYGAVIMMWATWSSPGSFEECRTVTDGRWPLYQVNQREPVVHLYRQLQCEPVVDLYRQLQCEPVIHLYRQLQCEPVVHLYRQLQCELVIHLYRQLQCEPVVHLYRQLQRPLSPLPCIITQPISWYSFYHRSKCRRLSWPRCWCWLHAVIVYLSADNHLSINWAQQRVTTNVLPTTHSVC